jgi:hypothetical protein
MNFQTFFKIYKLIKDELDWEKNTKECQIILESAYSILNDDHWKVIGITKLASDLLVKNDFEVSANGRTIICRAHINERRDTFLDVINREWNDGQEIFDYIKEKDICLLAAKNENKKGNKLISFIDIPREAKLFKPRTIGFSYTRKLERQWLIDNIPSK